MPAPCDICQDTGRTTLCPSCGGEGTLGVTDCYVCPCPDCGQTGHVPEHDCLRCRPAVSDGPR